MKRVLMVAFHFPPQAGSSGVQRTLRFVQHLPTMGWKPFVLSAEQRAYESTRADLLTEIPEDTVVRRAFALDSARHLAISGRYLAATARPDRWISWKFAAVRQGMRMIEEFRPDVIWLTYPIATAHLIAGELQRRSGLPWIADFRDPMLQELYPSDPATRRQFQEIERSVMALASYVTFTTPGAVRLYSQRYPECADKVMLLENGYDEASFVAAEMGMETGQSLNPGVVTLLHSGLVYPDERDPNALFVALRALNNSLDGRIRLKIRFRAAGNEAKFVQLAERYEVGRLVEFMPPIPYKEALEEMLRADGLLIMQAASCNEQIPAKLYEYFRARRPVIALTDPDGDTAGLLRASGANWIAPLDDSARIASLLSEVLNAIQAKEATLPTVDAVLAASRLSRAKSLVQLFESAT